MPEPDLPELTHRHEPRITRLQTDWVANFIWGIADDVLRNLIKRDMYADPVLPIRRLVAKAVEYESR